MIDILALLICGFLFGFTLAFGIGANDVANTFGTSVGSRAITIRRAFILASICETIGAVLLGGGVSSSITKGIIDVNSFIHESGILMLGYLSALIASTIWMIVATLLKLPVSGTQSAIGAMIGMAVVVVGFEAVHWTEIIQIASSWVISPLLSGSISAGMFIVLKIVVFRYDQYVQLTHALKLLPIFYAITLAVNIFACLFGRPKFISDTDGFAWPWYAPLCTASFVGIASALYVHFLHGPRLKRKILAAKTQSDETIQIKITDDILASWAANPVPPFPTVPDDNTNKKTSIGDSVSDLSATSNHSSLIMRFLKNTSEWSGLFPLFWTLQIITSCFAAVAHGGNDVANAVAPIMGMYEIYETGRIPSYQPKPELWILFYGGVGITVGLWALGRKVIETIGGNLAEITPPKGFVIELGTSMTVLLANQIGLPISTTFCKVGSIVFVGLCNGKNEVSWRLLFNVIMAWVFTVPITALMSAGVMAALQTIIVFNYHKHSEMTYFATSSDMTANNLTTINNTQL